MTKYTLPILTLLLLAHGCDAPSKPSTETIPKTTYLSYETYKATEAAKASKGKIADGFILSPPNNWQRQESDGMRMAHYIITEGTKVANFTLIKLTGESGSMLANVNRWRGQLALKPITEQQLRRATKEVPAQVGTFTLIDIQKIQKRGDETDRILAAILKKDNDTYFFKLMGPHTLVGIEKKNFVLFLETLKREAK